MEFLFFLLVVVIIPMGLGMINEERQKRREVEKELQATRESLRKLCEACIEENNSVHARITYAAYFGEPVDHTGDGFIDGYE